MGPPPPDWIKLNSDGYLSKSMASCAAILRDRNAKILGLSHSALSSQPIHLIELRGALMGLQQAIAFVPDTKKI